MQKIVFFACLLLFIGSEAAVFLKGRFKNGFLQPPVHDKSIKLPPDQWFSQKLDHFNPQDLRSWKQRYFVNDTFYKPGGPVFVQIGGEGTASPIWMVTGSWVKYGQSLNALLFQLEHRYYGKSHPVSDISTENLKWLSSEQALEDLANFRNAMSEKWNLGDAKWIAFGGSYPGSLATWFRMKYPHLVHGSVATSAPLVATADFSDYLRVVKESLDTARTPNCNSQISKATTAVTTMLGSADGRAKLKSMFKLCDDIAIEKPKDIQNLYSTLAGNFEGVVQYNKDNRGFEGGRGANITLDTLCDIMGTPGQDPLTSYSMVNDLLMRTYEQKCVDFSYDNMISGMKNTSWDASASEGGRQWTYQTCTEFGYYQTSSYSDQPFGRRFPLKFWTQQCSDIFGPTINDQVLYSSINFTNYNYGGLDVKVSRIVWPNGSIDPWHALSIIKSKSDSAVAIFINGTAHCANMYPDSPDDSIELILARVEVYKYIQKWLSED